MKRLLFLFISCLSFIGLFSACNTKNDYDPVYQDLGTITQTSNNTPSGFNITRDDNSVLIPSNASSYLSTVKNGQRVLVNYTRIKDNSSSGTSSTSQNIKIQSLYSILTMPIFNITPTTQDSIGNNPISIDNMWISGNYLNFQLRYYGGTTTHLINLVKDAQKQDPTGVTINLELRHNNKGDAGQVPIVTIVSFDISSLQNSGKKFVNISVLNKDYNNQTTTKQIIYSWWYAD